MIAADLLVIMPYAGTRVQIFFGPLLACMNEFSITTPRRCAAFLAQIAHESAELRYTAEIADGSAYEGRHDLGNTEPGDGRKYKGRGLIQVTGKTNYELLSVALGLPAVEHPEILEEPENACRSAGWFWQTRSCNALADADKFGSLTKTINGGYNGLDQRIAYWLRARTVLRLS